ncbi:PAAR-like protein [Sinomicrobium sp. M5D2P9]
MKPNNPFVPHGTKSVCTNGLKPSGSEIVVSPANNMQVKLAGGKLMATELDKPMNFACKWAGIIVAAIVALCVSMPFIVGILVAALAGIAASFSIGNAMCYIATRNSPWTHTHPQVKIEGKKVITSKSTMNCMFGGQIKIFMNPAVANAMARANATGNVFEIFMGAVGGGGVRGLVGLGRTLWGVHWSLGIGGPAVTVMAGIGINETLAPQVDNLTDKTSGWITNENDQVSAGVPSVVDQSTSADIANITTDAERNAQGVRNNPELMDEQTRAARNYNEETRRGTFNEAHERARQARINGDRRPYREIFNEELRNEHQRRIHQAEQTARENVTRMSRAERLRTWRTSIGSALSGFGFVLATDIIANTAYKAQLNMLDNWGNNEEALSKANAGVYATDI